VQCAEVKLKIVVRKNRAISLHRRADVLEQIDDVRGEELMGASGQL
jgi:hypothetical protein